MLDSTLSVLIIADAAALDDCAIPPETMPAVLRLVRVAKRASIPIIVARYPPSSEPGPIETAVSCTVDVIAMPFDPVPAAWPQNALGQAIARTGRTQVVIIGVWLEEAVTLLALNALLVGLEPYVPNDATPVREPRTECAARARLAQATVVPTSTGQVVREWAALHRDGAVAADMRAALLIG